MFDSLTLLAAAAAAPAQSSPFGFAVPMVIIFGIFYFMMIRPQQRKEKERRAMIEAIKSGTRVVFCGGLIGRVTNVKESTFVIQIADRVKVEVLRAAVNRVLEKGEKLGSEEDVQQQ